MILKTLSTKSAKLRKGGVGVGDDSRVRCDGMDDVEVDNNEFGDDEVRKKSQKIFKSKNLSKSKKMVGSDFFLPRA